MATPAQEKGLHRLFELGVIIKAVNAALELALGFLLLFVNVAAIVQTFAAAELVEDPDNFLVRHLSALAGSVSAHAQFVSALYLLSHGIIKAVLVFGLLRDKLWAYPASIAVLALFVAYQVITYTRTLSLALLLLTIFDLVLIWLIYHEYRHHAHKR
ncbi:MAG TPA: DUF2127 domain-containing protein [Candidatus Paceibacterota bacterium]|nr:DUF2127 domain-containing protein [Candidatus Paceibacterota bacterium]